MTETASYSRNSFIEIIAPHDQACACGCGEHITRGQACFARPFIDRGKQKGFTRIVNMEHYDDWFENVAHAYSQKIVSRHPELRDYYEQ